MSPKKLIYKDEGLGNYNLMVGIPSGARWWSWWACHELLGCAFSLLCNRSFAKKSSQEGEGLSTQLLLVCEFQRPLMFIPIPTKNNPVLTFADGLKPPTSLYFLLYEFYHSLKLTASVPLKIGLLLALKGKRIIFQPSIFRWDLLVLREGKSHQSFFVWEDDPIRRAYFVQMGWFSHHLLDFS